MIVIDASVWVSYLMPQDINHQASRLWLDQQLANRQRSAAPSLVLVEVAGAIIRRTNQLAMAQQAVVWLSQLRTLSLKPLTRPAALATAQLAINLQLRGADATYVSVAQRLGAPLISWDAQQLSRAASLIQVYTPSTAP